MLWQPERFGKLLVRALGAGDEIAKRAGQIWSIAALRANIPSMAPAAVDQLPPAARRGAAEIFAEDPGSSVDFLVGLFSDEDGGTRKAAATAERQLADVPTAQAESLIIAFLSSDSVGESYEGLVRVLPDLPQLGPEVMLQICERATELAGPEVGDVRTSLSLLGQPIMRAVLIVYRLGGLQQRERCLDVIDRLSERNAYGWQDVTLDDRWI